MLRDELYSKIGLVGWLGLAILIPKKLWIESFSKCRDRYRASRHVISLASALQVLSFITIAA